MKDTFKNNQDKKIYLHLRTNILKNTKNEDDIYFQHDMAYGKSKDLVKQLNQIKF